MSRYLDSYRNASTRKRKHDDMVILVFFKSLSELPARVDSVIEEHRPLLSNADLIIALSPAGRRRRWKNAAGDIWSRPHRIDCGTRSSDGGKDISGIEPPPQVQVRRPHAHPCDPAEIVTQAGQHDDGFVALISVKFVGWKETALVWST
ncbi:hypothetical protein [Rhizobium mesosinicum]|uniref:hypothetical protein n=1 Tax=Rhizobium mesosinicum TaxID=335017 RepID=UPI00308426ED